MLLYPASCMKNSAGDDVDMSAAWLHQVATNEPRQDGHGVREGPSLPALQQLQVAANRHRLEAIMNTDATAAASKSSLAFILGGSDEDQTSSFADLAVSSGAPRDESATENREANVPAPAAAKAAIKKSRICKFENCTRYVVNRGLCIGHGGGKRCAVVGCTSSAKNLGVCWKHGGSTKCTVAGCENRAKSRGVCWSHGGGRKCSEQNCTKTAVSHGLCWAHGGGKRCVVEGCRKPAYERNGNVCSLHQATSTGALPKSVKR
ncbi:putative WRKY transcription factor 19 [Phytophthora ramorum]|uniref:putative WRKY transcription factor 19 n=1 Tax=Phytophthora ramorum TaxID=164328 RepID=UPI0030A520B2|nr:putative WRKY transcription factor 19 [Phytophthora ramorum]